MRPPLAASVAALALIALGAMATPALACGAFFATEASQNLAIDAQRALMIVADDTIALHLQLAAATDGKAFSWVIPVPAGGGAPTVALGDQAIFDALDALTTPSVTISHGGGGGGGGLCAGDSKAGGLDDTRGGVQHFGGASLGDYTYDIIAGSKPEEVAAWLTDHGYVVPAAFADAVAPYTDKNVFVAVRLAAGSAASGATNRPLVVTWPRAFEADLGYAFGLSKLSAADVTPLLLWVLADKRQRIANYGSIDVKHVADAMRDDGLAYDEAIASLTEDAGGRLVTTEFAKDLRSVASAGGLAPALAALVNDESFYLTRLYAEVPRAAIEDLVITFAANAPDVEPVVTVSRAEGGPVVVASSLFALAWLRRRRPI